MLVRTSNDPFSPAEEQHLILFGMAHHHPSRSPHSASVVFLMKHLPDRGVCARAERIDLSQGAIWRAEMMPTGLTQQHETDPGSHAMLFAKGPAKEKTCQAAE